MTGPVYSYPVNDVSVHISFSDDYGPSVGLEFTQAGAESVVRLHVPFPIARAMALMIIGYTGEREA